MPIPDNFKLLDQTELQKKMKDFKPQFIPINTQSQRPPEVLVRQNPIHETNKLLEEQNEKIDDLSAKLEEANLEISKQTKELKSIHYENLKLNAQINILNKTLDCKEDELIKLKDINAELKVVNQTLKENNKHYWRNTILVSLGVGIVMFILGLYATEVKSLLQLMLNLLK